MGRVGHDSWELEFRGSMDVCDGAIQSVLSNCHRLRLRLAQLRAFTSERILKEEMVEKTVEKTLGAWSCDMDSS